jgi:hypothetical protein
MSTPTLFSWGYYGWGNATRQLVDAADAVEQARGFAPPLFVDIRIRRTVRAAGFSGPAFERLLGPDRHRWMKSLGNNFIRTRTGPFIQIADPAAASSLLSLALSAARDNRRVLFFCSCPFPRHEGQTACHRDTVASLVLEAAAAENQALEVVEWPGGEPKQVEVETTPEIVSAVRRGRATVPLGPDASLPAWAGLPWGSVVALSAGERRALIVSGPAGFHKGDWQLPVFRAFNDPETPRSEAEAAGAELRRSRGLDKQRQVSG